MTSLRGSAALAVVVALYGCPGPQPLGSTSSPPPPRLGVPRYPRPALGQPPYRVLIMPEAGQGVSRAPTTALAHLVAKELGMSGMFVARVADGDIGRFDQSGQPALRALWTREEPAVVRIGVVAHMGRLQVRATISFAAIDPVQPYQQRTFVESQLPKAAQRLASLIHRAHTGVPGPYFSRIAFVAATAEDHRSRQIFVMGFAGDGVQRVTHEGRLNILPAWGPHGDLAFTSFARGSPELMLLPAREARAERVSSRDGLNTGAEFSPDGKTIALTLSHTGNTDIYLIARDGRILRRLTHHPKIDVSPTWSPDGTRIAFVSDRSGSPQIYVTSMTGGPVRRLTIVGTYNQEPDWCPRAGSTLIAYTRGFDAGHFEIYTIDASTGEMAALTHDGGANKGASWSPDCRLLVYSAGSSGLYVTTADGKARWRVYRGRADTPAWSRLR